MVRDNNALREILRKPNAEASSLALCLARRKKAIANQPQDDYQRLMNTNLQEISAGSGKNAYLCSSIKTTNRN